MICFIHGHLSSVWGSDLKYCRRSINICCKKEMRGRRKELRGEGRRKRREGRKKKWEGRWEAGRDLVWLISSVAQSRPTPCDHMDCSTPGFPVLHIYWSLLKLVSMSWQCYSTILSSVVPFSSSPQSFPVSGSFPLSQFFTSGGQMIEVSASASVLPKNIQD